MRLTCVGSTGFHRWLTAREGSGEGHPSPCGDATYKRHHNRYPLSYRL